MQFTLNITREDGTDPSVAELLAATEHISYVIFTVGLGSVRPVDKSDPTGQLDLATFASIANRSVTTDDNPVVGSWNLTPGDVDVHALVEASVTTSLAQYIDDNPGEPVDTEDYTAGHSTGFIMGRESVLHGR